MKCDKMKLASVSSGLLVGAIALFLAIESSYAVITVQIGGATRLTSPTRSRYHCYWDCDLVGCQLTRDDDECAYDCEKICRPRYDYLGRSGAEQGASGLEKAAATAGTAAGSAERELKPKSASVEPASANQVEKAEPENNQVDLGK